MFLIIDLSMSPSADKLANSVSLSGLENSVCSADASAVAAESLGKEECSDLVAERDDRVEGACHFGS